MISHGGLAMDKHTSKSNTEIPFVKDFPFEYGVPDEIRPGVRRIIARNPGPFTYTGSGTYTVSDDRNSNPCAIIDPGPDNIDHINALLKATSSQGISHILITHTHSDHCGGAKLLQEKCGAPIFGYGPHPIDDVLKDAPALDEGADYQFKPDHLLIDGDKIDGDGWTLEALWTPGHISNHLCFALPAQQILFTGDHIMGWATTVIIPPDGSMTDYFASLDKLLDRDDAVYLPTHGAPISKPQQFVRAIRTHRKMRDAQIIHQLEDGKSQIPEIVATIYAGIDKKLHVAAGLNVLAHLIGLCHAGRVICNGEATLSGRYALSSNNDMLTS